MSYRAVNAVLIHSQAENSERLIMLVLAHRANDKGQAEPGIARIARDAHISERMVHYALAELVEMGEITIEPNAGAHRTNRYTLNLPGVVEDVIDAPDDCTVQPIAGCNDDDIDAFRVKQIAPKSESESADNTNTPSNLGIIQQTDTLGATDCTMQTLHPAKQSRPASRMSETSFNYTLFQTAGIREPALTKLAERAAREHLSAADARAWLASIKQVRDNGKIKDPVAFAISQVEKQGFKPLVRVKVDVNDFDEIKRRYGGYMRQTGTEG